MVADPPRVRKHCDIRPTMARRDSLNGQFPKKLELRMQMVDGQHDFDCIEGVHDWQLARTDRREATCK